MDKSRNFILDRLKSKKTSIEEFNFDKLQAPPLSIFLTPFDIQELYSIASSLKYSAQPQVRYQLIDNVCKRRGLIKFAAGTNRVVYRHPEFPDYLIKIAADNIGLGDNPAEYKNQFLLKPFIAKTFEISPCGTVALVEKCNPITSREEFLSIADDVFEVITEWLIGKYVLADIGAKYFMNWSCRVGFGPVLIDYPYLYELDGNKLFCNKPDETSKSGKCDGVIDYDNGYNYLYCTKCGAKYRAKELETKIKDNELIIGKKGDIKMNIKISGGTDNVEKTVVVGNNESNLFGSTEVNVVTHDSVNPTPVVVNTQPTKINLKSLVNNEPAVAPVRVKAPTPVITEIKEEKVEEEVKEELHVVTDEEFVENTPIKVNKSVNGVSTEVKKDLRCPLSFDESVKEEVEKDAPSKVSPVEEIEKAIKTINDNIGLIDIDSVKKNTLNRIFDYVIPMMGDNLDTYNLLAKTLYRLYDEIEVEDNAEFNVMQSNTDLSNLFKRMYTGSIEVTGINKVGTDIQVNYDVISSITIINEDDEEALVEMFRTSTKDDVIILQNVYDDENDDQEESAPEAKTVTEEATEENKSTVYNGMKIHESRIISVNELFPDEQPRKVLAIIDVDGGYIVDSDNCIITVSSVDNKSLEATELVSSKWLKGITKKLESYEEIQEQDSEPEAEHASEVSDEVEDTESDGLEVKEDLPLGAMSMTMEELLESESNTEE